MRKPWFDFSSVRNSEKQKKVSLLRRLAMGGSAMALALAGLVVFATEASAHDNYVSATASCASPLGSGATITWTLSNDYPASETGTATANGGSLTGSPFSIASTANYPNPPVSTATLTQKFTASQLASQISSNPTITLNWSATWASNPVYS